MSIARPVYPKAPAPHCRAWSIEDPTGWTVCDDMTRPEAQEIAAALNLTPALEALAARWMREADELEATIRQAVAEGRPALVPGYRAHVAVKRACVEELRALLAGGGTGG